MLMHWTTLYGPLVSCYSNSAGLMFQCQYLGTTGIAMTDMHGLNKISVILDSITYAGTGDHTVQVFCKHNKIPFYLKNQCPCKI